jgi:hypothetical protein
MGFAVTPSPLLLSLSSPPVLLYLYFPVVYFNLCAVRHQCNRDLKIIKLRRFEPHREIMKYEMRHPSCPNSDTTPMTI